MIAAPSNAGRNAAFRTVQVRRSAGREIKIRGARLAMDRVDPSAKSAFIRAKKAEHQYATQLRKVARHVGDLVKGLFDPESPASVGIIEDALRRYAGTIESWAGSVGERMVREVAARDRTAWMDVARVMGRALHEEIAAAPTGAVMQQRLTDQVQLITSLPTEAAERVRTLATEGIVQGRRAEDLAADILATGQVTKSRANTIARTEVSRTATELTRARAEHIGCTHFIWRTAGDSDVRSSHRRLNGKAFRFDDPPECDPGHRALPGGIWNCRCYAEPIIPDEI